MDLATRLKGEPSLTDIQLALRELDNIGLDSPNSRCLPILVVLLQHTIPALFPNLDIFVSTFSTPAGLSTLISRLHEVGQGSGSQEPFTTLLDSVLRQPNLVKHLLMRDRQSALKIFWGSKILSSGTSCWYGDSKKYTMWLATQMLDIGGAEPLLFDKAAKLGECKCFVEFFLKKDRFHKLVTAFVSMRPFQQRYLLYYGLAPALATSPVASIARLLISLNPSISDLIDVSLKSSVNFQRAAVAHLRVRHKVSNIASELLNRWARSCRDHFAFQCSLTQILLLCACNLSTDEALRLSTTEDFLTGVSTHLESSSDNVRRLGMVVAEVYAKIGGGKLEFGQSFEDWVLSVDDPSSTLEEAIDDLEEKYDDPPVIPAEFIKKTQEPVVEDSDDETDDDQEAITAPLYIKTLVEYLQSDHQTKHYLALHDGPSLIRRKRKFGTEVGQYLYQLLEAAAGLTDKFDLQNFSELRQHLITAILIAEPQHAPPLAARMFSQGDYSLAQRLSILSGFVLASCELSNFSDREAPSKFLPDAQHHLFISEVDRLSSQISKGLVLSNDDTGVPKDSFARNEFGKVAPNFFFSLSVVIPPLEGYAAILGAQWLKSLALLVHNARLSPNRRDMATELIQIVLAYQSMSDPAVVEGLFVVLLCVCESTPEILLERFPAQVGILYDWIGSIVYMQEPAAQRVGATVLLKLQGVMDHIRERISVFD